MDPDVGNHVSHHNGKKQPRPLEINSIYIIISYVFMSPNNISYASSCRDGSAELPKTELCGQVISLKHTIHSSLHRHKTHCKDEIYYDFEKKISSSVFRLYTLTFFPFLFFISYFLIQKNDFLRTHCLRIKSFKNLYEI